MCALDKGKTRGRVVARILPFMPGSPAADERGCITVLHAISSKANKASAQRDHSSPLDRGSYLNENTRRENETAMF